MSLTTPAHAAFVERVEQRLSAAVGADQGAVAVAASRTLRSGGKRLRPLLVHLCAPAAAAERESLVIAGCAVELIHMATLVHDDQLDRASLRRGRPTVWATEGELVATATGDYLFARAFGELVETGDLGAVTLLADACLALARGELEQRADAYDTGVGTDRYVRRCELKTARLFSAACTLGGRAGGRTEDEVEALAAFGLKIGLAFQMLDDVLDVSGSSVETGKRRGTDLLDGTVTLPLILAREEDSELARLDLRSLGSPAEAEAICDRIAATGALERTRARATELVDEARAELSGRVAEDLERSLETVAEGVVDRYS